MKPRIVIDADGTYRALYTDPLTIYPEDDHGSGVLAGLVVLAVVALIAGAIGAALMWAALR